MAGKDWFMLCLRHRSAVELLSVDRLQVLLRNYHHPAKLKDIHPVVSPFVFPSA